jgi:lysozyme family protein
VPGLSGVAHHWEENKLNRIDDEQLAAAVLELCIEVGGSQAVRLLQRALNAVASQRVEWLQVDGYVGPATINFANRLPVDEVLVTLRRLANRSHPA